MGSLFDQARGFSSKVWIMTLQELEEKFVKSVVMIETKGKKYAEARSLYNYVYEMKKVVLASCSKILTAKQTQRKKCLALLLRTTNSTFTALKRLRVII